MVPGKHRHLDTVRSQLKDYFAGKKLGFEVPLAPVGSAFQLRAWKILQSIPVGETRSYSWMAKRLGDENARRAVGRANGTNMICIVIPCHRVIRADGTLCGYGGGLWRKKWLLDHERRYTRGRKQLLIINRDRDQVTLSACKAFCANPSQTICDAQAIVRPRVLTLSITVRVVMRDGAQ